MEGEMPKGPEASPKDVGMDRRKFLATLVAAGVTGVLSTPKSAEAQTVLKRNFQTYRDAQEYASKNGYALVNTSTNGTVFVSEETLQQIVSTPGFQVNKSGTGINYLISTDPNTNATILDKFIIGGPNARIDIQEARERGNDKEENRPEPEPEPEPEP